MASGSTPGDLKHISDVLRKPLADLRQRLVLVRVRHEPNPCEKCGKPIGPGYLYVVGPPPEHVSCPTERKWLRDRTR